FDGCAALGPPFCSRSESTRSSLPHPASGDGTARVARKDFVGSRRSRLGTNIRRTLPSETDMLSRHMVRTALLLTIPCAVVRAQTRSPSDPIRDLDAYTSKAVADWKVPGLAIAVVKDGRIVFAKAYGVRELGKPAPVDTQTLFAIGSTTKAMTAASIGMLVDEGKLRWDDRVTRILPSFQLADPYTTRELTVRDLLTHRAGLGNADVLWYRTDNSPEEDVRRVRFAEPAYSLRSSFIYQNIMYAVAGQIVAAASGMPWEQFVRTRIFSPVGMPNTVPLLDSARRRTDVATPHYRVGDTVRVIGTARVGAVA